MMVERLPSLLAPLLALLVISFLIFRLRLFTARDMAGRYAFLFGGILIFVAAVWQVVRLLPDYDHWFLVSVYPILDLLQFALLSLGFVLVAVGLALYADYWQTRRERLDAREGMLSILDNLQRDARKPYQLLELLNISIREMLYHLPDCAGAIFLLNRSKRQFVLAVSSALSKTETARLEHYPFGPNLVSQAVELGEPIIGGNLDLIDRDGVRLQSRFDSCLALPLISGTEKVGVILLLSGEPKSFSKTEIRCMTPVADWLAEKIRVARMTRELSISKNEKERTAAEQASLAARITSASQALLSSDAVNAFCRSLTGLAGSESVHLVGLRHGALVINGGSESLIDLSEAYKTALMDAIDRSRSLIINQETAGESGRPQVAVSTLVFPLNGHEGSNALLFRRSHASFKVDDRQLAVLDIFAHLSGIVLALEESNRLNITRRRGFEAVLKLLKFDAVGDSFHDDPGCFARLLVPILPTSIAAATFGQGEDNGWRVVDSHHVDIDDLSEFHVVTGEGELGQAAATGQCSFLIGRSSIAARVAAYEAHNRNGFQKLKGERGQPSFLAVCPIVATGKTVGLVMLLFFDLDETQSREWERLLTLATGLYSLRLTMSQPPPTGVPTDQDAVTAIPGSIINELNNHLSALIGNAEVAAARPEISDELRRQLSGIIVEAERTAAFVKEILPGLPMAEGKAGGNVSLTSLDGVVESVLVESRISGDLYMAGGRPREISMKLRSSAQLDFPGPAMKSLFESVLSRFSSTIGDDEIVSVVTYRRKDAVYLDVSRHHKNFPPVEPVAGFGRYEPVRDAIRSRSSDVFLEHVSKEHCEYAFDRDNPSPAFLSFKFPLRADAGVAGRTNADDRVRILAIDDHAVILDLISAMGQSLGYLVDTALRGETGVLMAGENDYDVIMTDLAMPDISGLEVARRIHNTDPETPIILVTGWEASLDRDQLRSAGIQKVLYKPFRIEQLTEIVRSTASNRV